MKIEESEGYKKLITSVKKDDDKYEEERYMDKFNWIIKRAKHYAEKTGLEAGEVLDLWESARSYWYMNFYQDCNQPLLDQGKVFLFDTRSELLESVGKDGFRCPACEGVSSDPYECDQDECDWKSYGLLRCLGKGASIFVKEAVTVERIFMPVAWEDTNG